MLAATHRCKKILKTRFFPKVDQARASWDEDVSQVDAVNPKHGACDLGAMGQRVVSHQEEGGLPCRPRVAAAAASSMSGWGKATPTQATARTHGCRFPALLIARGPDVDLAPATALLCLPPSPQTCSVFMLGLPVPFLRQPHPSSSERTSAAAASVPQVVTRRGEVLLVSQFTLYARLKKPRPDFSRAMSPQSVSGCVLAVGQCSRVGPGEGMRSAQQGGIRGGCVPAVGQCSSG